MIAPAHSDPFVGAYLRRLGVERRPRADAAWLAALHRSHLERIPFENLSIHLNEPISLDLADLADKILHRHRGGFCYELNGLFGHLLTLLGYQVTLLGARVWGGETCGPPLAHLALRVTTVDGERWLADVGFGDHSLYPLRWAGDIAQQDPGGTFRLRPVEGGDWEVYRNDVPQYRVEAHPRALSDFGAMCWYHQTSPLSHFTRSTVCTRRSDDGRVTLSGRRLINTTTTGKTESELTSDDDLLEAYRTVFGIALERLPDSEAVPRGSLTLAA